MEGSLPTALPIWQAGRLTPPCTPSPSDDTKRSCRWVYRHRAKSRGAERRHVSVPTGDAVIVPDLLEMSFENPFQEPLPPLLQELLIRIRNDLPSPVDVQQGSHPPVVELLQLGEAVRKEGQGSQYAEEGCRGRQVGDNVIGELVARVVQHRVVGVGEGGVAGLGRGERDDFRRDRFL